MGVKKIYILTNFSAYLKSYSPIIVVGEQLNMLKRAGYEPVLIASQGWNPPESSIFDSIKTERIFQPIIDGTTVDDAFEREVERIYGELNEIIDDNSVVITHDLIFLPDYVKHNVACRRIAAERPSISWMHWIHSATSPGVLIQERAMFGEKYKQHLSEKFPNSVICFPNAYDIPRVARNFGYEEDEVYEVPHSSDLSQILSPRFKRLYDEKRLGDSEVLMCLPLRLDRGKQAEMNIRLIAGCRRRGMTAHVVFCDFQSTGDDKVVYREELKKLAIEQGVEDCVTFLSEFDESAKMEVGHTEVLLFQAMCNVFLSASKSETYSLVAQEAMGFGNLCILNHDFAPMRQIYGQNAIYKQFSSNIGIDGQDGEITTTYSDIDAYFNDIATHTQYWLEHDKTLRGKTWVRVYRNPDYIFKQFVEPLLTRSNDDAEEIQEAEIFDRDTSVLRVAADTIGSIEPETLSREDNPARYQVDSEPTVS
jgi:glycosyltransferase involved in cell wall biosynthesis